MKTLLLWSALILLFLALLNAIDTKSKNVNHISFSEFVEQVKKDEIKDVNFRADNVIDGSYKEFKSHGFKYFATVADTSNPKIFEILEKHNIVPNYDPPKKPSVFWTVFLTFAPILLLVFGTMYMMKKSSGGTSNNMFGKSRARMISSSDIKTKFKDVAGAEESKEELEEIVEFLKNPKKFQRLGGEMPKGVLMVGPPGTGKTLLAKAVAGEAGVPFITTSGSDFVEMFVGVGASRVRDLFEMAKKNAPCIIFIDEIDAIGKKRGGSATSHDERDQTLNQLLVEMDGFDSSYGVIVIAATNRAELLDDALLRPGRFDRKVTVTNPDVRGREAILKVHTRHSPLDQTVNLEVLAKGTSGFSGADLKNLVNEASLRAAKLNKTLIDMVDFEYAKDKVIMGVEKRSMVMSDKEKRVTAYHEAGHAIVGLAMENVDPIHKVTIIPRGSALGLTQTLPEEDRLSLTKQRAEDNIAFLMGGRVAEELVLNEITTGASNDIERATGLARRMVCNWGMSSTLGPINFDTRNDEGYKVADLSNKLAETVDSEISQIVNRNHQRARDVLTSKMDKLHLLAQALLEKETLDANEVNQIVNG